MQLPRNRLAWIALVGLVANAAYWAHAIVERSGQPGRYYKYRNDDSRFVFPSDEVRTWVAALVIETLLAALFISLARDPARRCAWLAIPAIVGSLAMFPLAMHAPPYFTGHLIGLFVMGVWLLLAAAVIHAIERRRAK